MPEWQTIMYPNSESLASGVCELLRQEARPNAVWCLASGGSPERSYRKFAASAEKQMKQLRLVLLDEWLGLEAGSASSCRTFIQDTIAGPLGIAKENFLCFDTVGEPQQELSRVGQLLPLFHPFDLCVLGLGRNGHIGFNEPAATLSLGLHVTELSNSSLLHPMVREMTKKPSAGISMGMEEILSARKILLIVQGPHKAKIYQEFLDSELNPQLPASFLKLHSNLQIHIDQSSVEAFDICVHKV